MEGYLFCETPGAAMGASVLFGETIRYWAHLDDGTGFAAFDWYHPSLHEFGTVRMSEPLPDYPDSWPDWMRKAAPKRGKATRDQWFATVPYDEAVETELCALHAVSGLAKLENGLLLVESHGPVIVQSDGLNARAVYYEQARTEARLPA